MFFPLLQRFATLFHLFYILWGLFLVDPILCYFQIVLSSTTKICYFTTFISRLMKSILCRNHSIILLNCSFLSYKDLLVYFIYCTSYEVFSCRTHSIVLSNCSFFYYKDLLIYYIYFTAYEVYFMLKSFYYIIKLFFPLLQRFATLFHLFYILWGLFLVDPILCYFQIVLSSTTKICYFTTFISRLMKSILCRNHSIILLNCSFLSYKDLLVYFIYCTSYEVFFL